MLKKTTTLLLCVLLSSFSFAQNNEINVINPETIVYDWEFNVTPDGTVLTGWNGPGSDGKGIATYFNIHDNEGNCKLSDGVMLVDELDSKLYTTAKQLSLLDRNNNTIIAYQTLDNAVNAGIDNNTNENYRLYKVSPEGEMLWGEKGIDLNRGKYSEATQGCLSMVQIEDGSFFIAWVEYVWSGDYEVGTILLDRIGPNGERLWEEALVFGDGTTPMTFPYLVNAGNNQIIMVYAKGSGQELYAKKFDFDGSEVWSDDTRIYRGGFGSIPIWTFLKVQSDGEGGVFVGWYDDRNNTNYERTYVAHILGDGKHGFASGEGGEAIGYTEGMRSFSPSIYYDKANQHVYVLRRETTYGGSHCRIMLQKLSMSGELLWDTEGVKVYPTEDIDLNLGYESLSDDGEGNIAVFFMRNDKTSDENRVSNIFTKVSKEDGAPAFESPVIFSPSNDNRSNMKVSQLIDNEYWVAMWEDKRMLAGDNPNVDPTELPNRLYMQRVYKDGHVDEGEDDGKVSTKPQNKKILLEEFTGIHCGNCPDGHAMAKKLHKSKPEDVFIIAVHAGYYSEPSPDQADLRTEDGIEIHNFYPISGYPSGMINRTKYEGDYVISRSLWSRHAKGINTETAPVNLMINCEYDDFYEEIYITVDGYWVEDSPSDSARLSIALLQNNIQAYQSGSGVGDEYMHQHVLRDYITDVFGDIITTSKKGEYFTATYTYALPEDYRGVVVVPEQLELIAFVTENESNILNVAGKKLSHPSFELPMEAEISEPKIPIGRNYAYSFLEMYLENKSITPITSASFDVELNGTVKQVEWTGNVPSLSMELISIPIDWTAQTDDNEWKVTLTAINGTTYKGNKIKGTFGEIVQAPTELIVKIKTDNYSDDNRFMIKDANGNIVEEFKGFTNGTAEEKVFEVTLEGGMAYCIEVTDIWGDGIKTPRGYIKIYDTDNNLVTQNLEISDFGWRAFINVIKDTNEEEEDDNTNVNEIEHNEINIVYTNDKININNCQDFKVNIYDMSGRCLMSRENENSISTEILSNGVYIVNVTTSNSNKTFKITK